MISTRGRYALRVMLDLAEHANEGNVALRDIAQRQVISKKYLEIIVRELVNANYVSGVSGKGGGYRLTKVPEEYTMYDILNLMETSLKPVACLDKDYPGCDRANRCKILPVWKELDEMLVTFYKSKTLVDFMENTEEQP